MKYYFNDFKIAKFFHFIYDIVEIYFDARVILKMLVHGFSSFEFVLFIHE